MGVSLRRQHLCALASAYRTDDLLQTFFRRARLFDHLSVLESVRLNVVGLFAAYQTYVIMTFRVGIHKSFGSNVAAATDDFGVRLSAQCTGKRFDSVLRASCGGRDLSVVPDVITAVFVFASRKSESRNYR